MAVFIISLAVSFAISFVACYIVHTRTKRNHDKFFVNTALFFTEKTLDDVGNWLMQKTECENKGDMQDLCDQLKGDITERRKDELVRMLDL